MWVQSPLIKHLLADSAQTKNRILSADDVSSAVIKQLVRGNSGQVLIPRWMGIASMVRGLPAWVQEMVRDHYSRRIT
jgi:hypothetical protein